MNIKKPTLKISDAKKIVKKDELQIQGERLQKFLAARGIGSRREIENWIREGKITIDGRLACLGDKATEQSKIFIENRPVKLFARKFKTKVLMYHKPPGEVCTYRDPENRPTVFERLPRIRQGRWVMVGRLDLNTEGLLIFTNNGELANRLMHPSYEIEREYAVRIYGSVSEQAIQNLTLGVGLEDGMAKFNRIIDAGGENKNHWYHVVLTEGRNREVRRLWESQGYTVSRLIRIRFGEISLPRFLKLGMYTELEANDIELLMKSVNLIPDENE